MIPLIARLNTHARSCAAFVAVPPAVCESQCTVFVVIACDDVIYGAINFCYDLMQFNFEVIKVFEAICDDID